MPRCRPATRQHPMKARLCVPWLHIPAAQPARSGHCTAVRVPSWRGCLATCTCLRCLRHGRQDNRGELARGTRGPARALRPEVDALKASDSPCESEGSCWLVEGSDRGVGARSLVRPSCRELLSTTMTDANRSRFRAIPSASPRRGP